MTLDETIEKIDEDLHRLDLENIHGKSLTLKGGTYECDYYQKD